MYPSLIVYFGENTDFGYGGNYSLCEILLFYIAILQL